VQLRAARRAGLRIPATLVSQDPERIRAFCAAHPGAIIKPVATPRGLPFTRTSLISQELLDNADLLALAPLIYQECVPRRTTPPDLARRRALRHRSCSSRRSPASRSRITSPASSSIRRPRTCDRAAAAALVYPRSVERALGRAADALANRRWTSRPILGSLPLSRDRQKLWHFARVGPRFFEKFCEM
jgi:hypothetical protein